MLTEVPLRPKTLADYRAIAGDAVVDEILELAAPLRGRRVLHINATAFGGGVAEILQTLVPLMRDVGLDAHWQVIEGNDEFFNVTKAMHNGLQGMEIPFSKAMQDTWLRHNQLNAARFDGDYDLIIVHDPQPAALRALLGSRNARWVWRCHIDTSTPNPDFWNYLRPYLEAYDAAIFTLRQFVAADLQMPHIAEIPPSIDPLSPKNRPMPLAEAAATVRRFGMDTERPLLVQVSRFDPWKDPLGVIDAYRLVKREVPNVQLALVGSMATDDPEGWDYYDRTVRHAGEDYDIRILHNFHGVGAEEVNAFQWAADVVIQKSTREGFGLVVTEALWKGKPVIGGKVGGIPLQVIDGKTGFLVETPAQCAEKSLYCLRNPRETRRMGEAGREHVRDHFLTTRHLRDYLQLFQQVLGR